MSLYQLERERDLEDLVEVLQHSDNPSIRKRAAEVIGDILDTGDVEESDLVLESDETDDLGLEALEAEADRETVIDVLVRAVKDDENEGVRAAAVDALDKHSQEALERVVAELSGKDLDAAADWVAAKTFADVLEADQPELRMAAATGLGRVGDPSVTASLVDRLSDEDPRVRARSAVACGRIEDPRAVGPLEELITSDSNIDVRQAVARALGDIGTEGALSVLLDAAGDPSGSVRRVVADSLGQFGSVEPVDTLVGFLDDEHEMVRRTAMFSLVEILSNAPPQQSHEVRQAAADRLESATADEVIPPLTEILTESSGSPQRRNAAWLLGRVVGHQHREMAREALIEALGDDDGMTAQFAATSLTQLDDPGLERELLELARDETGDEDARSKALFVLGKVGGDRARDELGEFVDRTESDELREQAFSALSKLGGIGAGGI
ncbi:HEAT-PBS family taxis protein [Natronomonas pharaonis DSM 2160]|uniref:HEAT-PBS family taxis protein n=1 Tax=Natronomonas pharaonis (strain ATCC 35678 / DSM 2160 / CIP 103997 / JCM 8858 / NBRC 14720 / NCIMB 2260 / Gabara) TaxID=348780 RepID=A0A1U7EVT0_NATPD|nr:HEAT repeat domain-containing protein [Natronomonas pharaonis]CAI49175.1 HEAT-PBS family taxis protein [Natronomonas pharaonis DSM 2160]